MYLNGFCQTSVRAVKFCTCMHNVVKGMLKNLYKFPSTRCTELCIRLYILLQNTCWLGVDSGSYFACIALSVLLAHSVAGTVAMETRVTCHVSQVING